MAFTRLQQVNNSSAYINNPKNFNSLFNLNDKVERVFEFAYGMTFGNSGEHREFRTGGQTRRKNGELFINTFQGKLAEFGMHKYFQSKGFEIEEPDTGMWERGFWDSEDLIVKGKKINIKSVAFFSNLLLLETQDWDLDGNYIPNIGKDSTSKYDFFILNRIKPDGKSLMRGARLFYANEVDKAKLKDIILGQNWEFDIAGFITSEQLIEIIRDKFIIPQNVLLNGKIPMDAENYYCQSGDLQEVETLIQLL
jgi:hypothetical protein